MFALEEAHRRFSTAIFAVASLAVLSGTATQKLLSFAFDVNTTLFGHAISQSLPSVCLWVPIIIGCVCGACSLLFTRLFRMIGRLSKARGGRTPFAVKLIVIFAATALLGFFSASFIGTGHSLIEEILSGKTVWYSLLLIFFVRAVLMLCANKTGVSGGIFVPNLAFGAMVASLVSEGVIAMGLLDRQYYAILIVVGMASFLAAASRTPITAIAFAAEVLCVASNILPVILGVTVSYIAAEILDKRSYTETVIEARAESAHQGKEAVIVYSHMTVQKGAFADGMQTRDILWPPTCTVLSIDRNRSHAVHHGADELHEGDELHLHYQTYDPEQTMQTLVAILGEQPENPRMRAHRGDEAHLVPMD
jgi:H+/Cl- antiporter ClcA